MPRQWSEAARLRRFVRAAERGYLTVHSGPDLKFVEVPRALAPLVAAASRSMELHVQHDAHSGVVHHFARGATAAAEKSGYIRTGEARSAHAVHRAANRAKHGCSATRRAASHASSAEHPPPQSASSGSSQSGSAAEAMTCSPAGQLLVAIGRVDEVAAFASALGFGSQICATSALPAASVAPMPASGMCTPAMDVMDWYMDATSPEPIPDVFDLLDGMVNVDAIPVCGASVLPRLECNTPTTWDGLSLVEAAHVRRALASACVRAARLAEGSAVADHATGDGCEMQKDEVDDSLFDPPDCSSVDGHAVEFVLGAAAASADGPGGVDAHGDLSEGCELIVALAHDGVDVAARLDSTAGQHLEAEVVPPCSIESLEAEVADWMRARDCLVALDTSPSHLRVYDAAVDRLRARIDALR